MLVNTLQSSIREYKNTTTTEWEMPALITPTDRSRDVFVNREVSLRDVVACGYDYDYTLASYNKNLPRLVYDIAQDFLVSELRYPSTFAKVEYDETFATRGLTYDRRTSALLKMDAFATIVTAFYGTKRMTPAEITAMYGTTHVSRQYRNKHMKPLVDLFSVAEACLIGHLVQHFADLDIEHHSQAIAEDIGKAIRHTHTSGALHKTVQKNPARYLDVDPELRPLLENLRENDKELFLLTNSSYEYINAGLGYLLGEDWSTLFDVVIVDADKPRFYEEHRPFRLVDKERGRNLWHPVTELKPGEAYSQGCVHDLISFRGWKGKPVLYIGDNLLSDSIQPRKAHGWITGCILRELEDHVKTNDTQRMAAIDERVILLENMMRTLQLVDPAGVKAPAARLADPPNATSRQMVGILKDFLLDRALFALDSKSDVVAIKSASTVAEALDLLEAERDQWRFVRQSAFHKNFGSEFAYGNAPTLFAFTVMRYVDLYTSRVSNFLYKLPTHRFFPNRMLLPHQHPNEL